MQSEWNILCRGDSPSNSLGVRTGLTKERIEYVHFSVVGAQSSRQRGELRLKKEFVARSWTTSYVRLRTVLVRGGNQQSEDPSAQRSMVEIYGVGWLISVPEEKVIGSLLNAYLICVIRRTLGPLNRL